MTFTWNWTRLLQGILWENIYIHRTFTLIYTESQTADGVQKDHFIYIQWAKGDIQ